MNDKTPCRLELEPVDLKGSLNKWTNYVLGWKSRFFLLSRGRLSYFKSEKDVQFASRGSIDVTVATTVPSELDDRCFNIRCVDVIWYLRTETSAERRQWIRALSMFSPEIKLYKLTEFLSVDYAYVVCEKIYEIQNCQNRLSRKLICLQSQPVTPEYFSAEAAVIEGNDEVEAVEGTGLFLNKRTKRVCTNYLQLLHPTLKEECTFTKHSCTKGDISISEDEFFDALDSSLESLEDQSNLDTKNWSSMAASTSSMTAPGLSLLDTIIRESEQQIQLARSIINTKSWIQLENEEDMQIYTREIAEQDGSVVDPLRASCTVRGITAKEACHYFFQPEFRKDLEPSVEKIEVVERLGDSALLLHQTYKKIWPVSQRDVLFWSNFTQVSDKQWAVVNKSVEDPRFPADEEKCIRAKLSVCLLCDTIVERANDGKKMGRNNVTCQLTYHAVVHPGGWVPASVVRSLRRREYPKFLAKFTSFVKEKTKSQEILM